MSESEETNVVVKAVDMAEEQQQFVIQLCRDAVEKYSNESDIAPFIKKNIEAADGPTWHCVVGASFGSMVAHTKGHFIHLKLKAPGLRSFKEVSVRDSTLQDWCYVLLFKTT